MVWLGEGTYNARRYCPLHRYQYKMKCQTRSAIRLTRFCITSKHWRYTTSEYAKECWHNCSNNRKTIWQLIYSVK
ncbi:MAG: hypothetical protein EZS28_037751 [Streblomastix strix]|uniref:Uncharacterized protein n=1 Tax=Streblomastix strix TaxID=222440 RepID=A0A5J4U955_9EUKA|nr:MAG: hypothetical protein EZS28_037751 [Streblomastix strix]